jgi:hypothetical protein
MRKMNCEQTDGIKISPDFVYLGWPQENTKTLISSLLFLVLVKEQNSCEGISKK